MEIVRHLPVIMYMANEILFNDDDDPETTTTEKVLDFAEETVPRFRDNQFKQNFRLCPTTFEDLLQKIHTVIPHENRSGHPQMSLEKQLMISIWYLANMEAFRSVAGRFGVSKSTAWDVLNRVTNMMLPMNHHFKILSWPTRERALAIIQEFENINGFPGILGAIDGTHIRILPPKNHPNSYYNRKKYHSVLLQGVCDDRKLFIDVFAGQPGSSHDARLFEQSDLSQRIQNRTVQFPNDSHIIGDLAYPLSTTLLVGFKDFGNLTNHQRNYNRKLSQCRVRIEQAFGFLKGRFRRLKFIETIRLDLISLLIVTACILHNICILNGDTPNDIVDIEAELEQIRNEANDNIDIQQAVAPNRREANQKRNFIMLNIL